MTCIPKAFNKFKFLKIAGVKTVKKYTYSAKSSDNAGKWFVVDAGNDTPGRLATQVAARIRGR